MNGSLQCVDMNTMSPVWIRDLGDSIVATPALEVEDENHVWLYIGTVINKGKKSVKAHMMKINALNGDLVWDTATEQNGLFASKTAKLGLYAGVQASPLVGEGDIDDLVVFNVNRLQIDKKTQSAIVYALDKSTGEVIWQQILDAESVSSPIALYRKDTNTSYIVMGDDGGTLRVMDGYNGITLDSLNLGGPIQASPAAYEEHIVVGLQRGHIQRDHPNLHAVNVKRRFAPVDDCAFNERGGLVQFDADIVPTVRAEVGVVFFRGAVAALGT